MRVILKLTQEEKEFLIDQLTKIYEMFFGNFNCLFRSFVCMNYSYKQLHKFPSDFIAYFPDYLSRLLSVKFSLDKSPSLYKGTDVISLIQQLEVENRNTVTELEIQVILELMDMYIRLCLGDFTQFHVLLREYGVMERVNISEIDEFLKIIFSPIFPGIELYQHKLAVHELPDNVKWLQDMYVTIQRVIAEYKQKQGMSTYSVYIGHNLRYSGNPDIQVIVEKD